MKKKGSNKTLLKIAARARRRQMIEDGFFDGRFRKRVEANKKKQKVKYACRKNKANR